MAAAGVLPGRSSDGREDCVQSDAERHLDSVGEPESVAERYADDVRDCNYYRHSVADSDSERNSYALCQCHRLYVRDDVTESDRDRLSDWDAKQDR